MSPASDCLLTVLMPVRDGESFLQQAIDSILEQSWRDFEFLIIDDASSDRTPTILAENAARDGRITLQRIESGVGTAAALNRGLELARGKLVARMDADDVAFTGRLQAQIDFMRRNPEIGISGGALVVYERPNERWTPPRTHEGILARMLFECPVFHPTVIMRRDVVRQAGGYSSDHSAAQDYELWRRLAMDHGVRFANLRSPLVKYRMHPGTDRSVYHARQKHTADKVRSLMLESIGLAPSRLELACHEALAREVDPCDFPPVAACGDWIERIEEANRARGIFCPGRLGTELRQRWATACVQAASCRRTDAFMVLGSDRGLTAPARASALARIAWHWWRNDCTPR